MNLRRMVMVVAALMAGVVGWKFLPFDMQTKLTRSSRRIAAGLAARVAFSLWRDTDVSSPDLDLGSVGFDWRSHPSGASDFLSELESAGVWAHEAGPLSDGHEAVVLEKLQDAGIHLDQEGSVGMPPPAPATRYVGTTSPQRLVDALSAALSQGRSGLVVDTNGAVIEIDQHPSVGAGLLVLLDESGAHLLRSGTNRALLQAIRVSADRAPAGTSDSRAEYVARMPDER
jgi:hypothetical protein